MIDVTNEYDQLQTYIECARQNPKYRKIFLQIFTDAIINCVEYAKNISSQENKRLFIENHNHRNRIIDSDCENDLLPSMGVRYPEMLLFQAMIIQAIKDLKSRDPLKLIDALCWWHYEGTWWINTILDLDLDDTTVFVLAMETAISKKQLGWIRIGDK